MKLCFENNCFISQMPMAMLDLGDRRRNSIPYCPTGIVFISKIQLYLWPGPIKIC